LVDSVPESVVCINPLDSFILNSRVGPIIDASKNNESEAKKRHQETQYKKDGLERFIIISAYAKRRPVLRFRPPIWIVAFMA